MPSSPLGVYKPLVGLWGICSQRDELMLLWWNPHNILKPISIIPMHMTVHVHTHILSNVCRLFNKLRLAFALKLMHACMSMTTKFLQRIMFFSCYEGCMIWPHWDIIFLLPMVGSCTYVHIWIAICSLSPKRRKLHHYEIIFQIPNCFAQLLATTYSHGMAGTSNWCYVL